MFFQTKFTVLLFYYVTISKHLLWAIGCLQCLTRTHKWQQKTLFYDNKTKFTPLGQTGSVLCGYAQLQCAATSLSGSYDREEREIEIQERGQLWRSAPAGCIGCNIRKVPSLHHQHWLQHRDINHGYYDDIIPSTYVHDVQRPPEKSLSDRKQQK